MEQDFHQTVNSLKEARDYPNRTLADIQVSLISV